MARRKTNMEMARELFARKQYGVLQKLSKARGSERQRLYQDLINLELARESAMLVLMVLLLTLLSGCTVHTHTWSGPPPHQVVYHQPVVVQRPVVYPRPQRVVYTERRRVRRTVRVPARPRRRGYRHR